MDKRIIFESITDVGQCFAEAVDITYRGGGGLEKIAGERHPEVERFLRSLKPDPRYQYVLMTPMGAFEVWGMNRNGDVFPERALAYDLTKDDPGRVARALEEDWLATHGKRLPPGNYYEFGHKTFLDALRYRHHCFPAGTPVVMGDRERRPIEEVAKGEWVATRAGPRRVVRGMSRHYKGRGVSLRLTGTLEDLVGTEDHPVMVLRRSAVHCRHKYSRVGQSKHGEQCPEFRQPPGPIEELPLSDVSPGDYLLCPVPPSEAGCEEVEEAFASAVGWVASGGYLSPNGYTIQFSFAQDNVEDIESVLACFHLLGAHVTRTPRTQFGVVMLTISSVKLHSQLSEYVRGTLSEKRLVVDRVLSWGPRHRQQLLGSYIDGDGHVCSSGKNEGQLRIRSSSEQMLYGLSDIVRSLGADCTLCWDAPPREMISPTNGKVYATSGSGCVAVSAPYSPMVTGMSRKHRVRDIKKRHQMGAYEGCYLRKVLDAEWVDIDETVYNLEVEDVHEYVANEVVVHNCNKDPSVSYGEIVLSVWNPLMRRVEVISRQDREKAKRVGAEEIINDIDEGKPRSISMGCRVPFDCCTRCGNISRTRRDYCDCLRLSMGKTNSDGTVIGAVNLFPRFFDLSDVFVPAARESGVLEKVAGVYMQFPKTAVQKKVAEIEKEVAPNVENRALRDSLDSEPDLPRGLMGHGDFGKLLATLAGMGIIAKPHEFQHGMLCRMGEKHYADALGERRMAFRYSPMRMRSRMEPDSFDSSLAERLSELLSSRSGFYPHLPQRMIRTVVIKVSPRRPLQDAPDSPELRKVAAAYTQYRASLVGLPDFLDTTVRAHPGFYNRHFFSDLLTDAMAKTASSPYGMSSGSPLVPKYVYNAYRDSVVDPPSGWDLSTSSQSPARALLAPTL